MVPTQKQARALLPASESSVLSYPQWPRFKFCLSSKTKQNQNNKIILIAKQINKNFNKQTISNEAYNQIYPPNYSLLSKYSVA